MLLDKLDGVGADRQVKWRFLSAAISTGRRPFITPYTLVCELLVDLFRRHFLTRSDETVARVVDEDIDSTKVIDSVRDDSRRGSWVGYVQRSRH